MPDNDLDSKKKDEIGERIRIFRKERHLTQEQLGLAVGAGTAKSAKAMIAKVERGQVPGGVRLQKFAEALKCSTDILLSGRSQDLFELVRYYVQPEWEMGDWAEQAFRAGRIFLFCAIRSGNSGPASELVGTANQFFYISQYEPDACRRLFKSLPKSHRNMSALARGGDLKKLVEQFSSDGFFGRKSHRLDSYNFASQMVNRIIEHYIVPQDPPVEVLEATDSDDCISLPLLPATYSAEPGNHTLKTIPAGTELIRIEDDTMEPLAAAGQFVIVASLTRPAENGQIVACWTRSNGVKFGRLISSDNGLVLYPVNPTSSEPLFLDTDDIIALRTVTGVLFE